MLHNYLVKYSPQILIIRLITLVLVLFPVSAYTSPNNPLEENNQVYLPIILTPKKTLPRVNAPFFNNDFRLPEAAIFWFGQVNPIDNYIDVRVGYNTDVLYVHVASFDRLLWYDTDPSFEDLADWDAVSLYLNLEGNSGQNLGINSFRFDAQLNMLEPRDDWQAAYRGNDTDWITASIPFITTSRWRGNAPNDTTDDRGWAMTYEIPFSSLGLSAPPAEGIKWGLAVMMHDRDDAVGTAIPVKSWPESMDSNRSETWGQLIFGFPTYAPPTTSSSNTTVIRQGLNGGNVVDAHVGGHTTCGSPYWPDFFNGWGEANYAGYEQVNIQNQFDVADWPCFSKFYVTFPLNMVPRGKVILSSKLRMFKFGNSGQGLEPEPQPSLVQVLTVKADWVEGAITWNNAPLAFENISGTWVDPVDSFPGYPGIPYEWDVSRAVAEAYRSGEPLRLVLYSADAAQHSGKYFFSSDIGEWNAEGRPTLEVVWGEP